ncbi:MAG: nucleotide-binding protein [Burkholderiaceae bacterium]|nr:nucleotide-binding protein [Burkholderiaceae bacterium]
MARINKQLLERLQTKLGLSQSRVYGLIDAKVRSAHLPRNLAAIAVAAERGVSISKFATADELAAIRQSAINAVPAPVVLQPEAVARGTTTNRGRAKRSARAQQRRGTTVFVVHGRDLAARDAVFAFVRSIGLRPLEWTQAIKLTKKGSPYVGEVLDAAFREAAAIVVLLTPDEEARLKPAFVSASDPAHERQLAGQARPNVLFEAGMAFGRDPNSTVLVQLGETRPFSDIGGRHVLHLSDSPASRQEFVTKLANAGCNVDTSGTDWLSAGTFKRSLTTASTRTRRKRRAG